MMYKEYFTLNPLKDVIVNWRYWLNQNNLWDIPYYSYCILQIVKKLLQKNSPSAKKSLSYPFFAIDIHSFNHSSLYDNNEKVMKSKMDILLLLNVNISIPHYYNIKMKLNINTFKYQGILKIVHHGELQGNNYHLCIMKYTEDNCNRKYWVLLQTLCIGTYSQIYLVILIEYIILILS